MSASPSVPFTNPPWIDGLPSPYYTDSHRRWQDVCSKYIRANLTEHAMEWEAAGAVPQEVFSQFAKDGFLIPNLPPPLPLAQLRDVGITHLPGGLPVEEYDYMHYLIYTAEMYRSGLMGPTSSIVVGISFGVPPIYKFGSSELQKKLLGNLLLGKQRACLAITEPDVGSDVANIQATAIKSADGSHYIVNGAKKWITNGIWADFATMAVRTGGPGPAGISILVVPLKHNPGVQVRSIKTSGNSTGGTSYISLEDVVVPADNLVGEEGRGLQYTLTNFNHERLAIAISGTCQARKAISTAFEYCMKRRAFGKDLIDQPVVRHRLASCGALIESQWAWVESLTYQISRMTKQEADKALGGLTALAKVNSGRVLDECSKCAVLLFGGNGITRGGPGQLVEMISREVGVTRIPGGSEDVLIDLAARELIKLYRRKLKELENGASKL